MKLESFENAVQIELRFLRKAIIGVGSGFIIMFVLVLLSKQNYFVQGGEFVKERALASWVCSEAFMSIVTHKPSTDLLTDEIVSSLKKSDFNVEVDELLAVQMIEENKCRLISKTGQVVRSFLVDLVGSKKNLFFYKLSEINEISISHDELEETAKEEK